MKSIKVLSSITALIALGACGPAAAQRWTHFLPFNNVNPIVYSDRAKTIWFGTGFNGVYRFDGSTFESFVPMTSQGAVVAEVTALALDYKSDVLWVGTIDGLFRFHIKDRTWQHFKRGAGLAENRMLSLYLDVQGNLWCGAMSSADIGRRDSSGQWFKFTPAGYFKWMNSSWVPDTTCGPLPSKYLTPYRVKCIVQDDEGNMLFGTNGDDLLRARPARGGGGESLQPRGASG